MNTWWFHRKQPPPPTTRQEKHTDGCREEEEEEEKQPFAYGIDAILFFLSSFSQQPQLRAISTATTHFSER